MSFNAVPQRPIRLLRAFVLPACLIAPLAGCTSNEELPASVARIQATDSEVELEFTIRLVDGTEVASSEGRVPLIVTMGKGDVFPALEDALKGLSPGDHGTVSLTARQAYGVRDEEAIREVQANMLPEDARVVGMVLLAQDDAGAEREVTVREIGEDTVVLDLNHPLAGKALTVDYKIVAVRRPDSAE